MAKYSYTVLVTGGNGFLGQHIVRLLHEAADFVTHIRVLDLYEFTRQLDYKERKPVEVFTGDLTDASFIEGATRGVNCVVHVASVVDVRTFPNDALLHKVNVAGTELLLDVCVTQNVRNFVYCSSQDVVIGYTDIVDGTESLEYPSNFLFGSYARSKYLAEQLVLRKNDSTLPNGARMRTLSVRPVVMHGDLDVHYVPEFLKTARAVGGYLPKFAGNDVYTQEAYVGNVAWMFICAVDALRKNPDVVGEVFFACDDTPLSNMFNSCEPYLKSHGMKLSSFVLPFWVIYLLVTIWTFIVRVLAPVRKINSNFTYASIRSINMRLNFTYTKAQTLLAYTPLYSHKESSDRSLAYYSQKHIIE